MNYDLKNKLLLIISIYFLVSCSGKTLRPINKDSLVSRKNTIVILDIQWVDNYFDINSKEVNVRKSNQLLSDDKLIKDHLLEIEGNESKLYSPLYYLNNFQFNLQNDNGDAFKIIRFNKNVIEYESLAIFDIAPGNYSLNAIEFQTQQFKEASEKKKPDEPWSQRYYSVDGEFGQWKLEPGKLYYLGSLTFYFKTKRFSYGFYNRSPLNKEVKFMGIKTEDKFEQVKNGLIKTNPWLPVSNIINLSEPLKWFHKRNEPLNFVQPGVKPEERLKNKTEGQQEDEIEEKRDTEKYFY